MNETIAGEAGAPDAAVAAKAPWHLWVIGIVSLLWHCFGAYDYVMSQMRNADYMRMMTEPYGIDTQAALDYFGTFPLWADAAWALGVWGAVAGSILLLLRSRFAFHAFALSLLGIVGSNAFAYANPLPGLTDSALATIMPVAIFVITALLAWYASRMTANGVLR